MRRYMATPVYPGNSRTVQETQAALAKERQLAEKALVNVHAQAKGQSVPLLALHVALIAQRILSPYRQTRTTRNGPGVSSEAPVRSGDSSEPHRGHGGLACTEPVMMYEPLKAAGCSSSIVHLDRLLALHSEQTRVLVLACCWARYTLALLKAAQVWHHWCAGWPFPHACGCAVHECPHQTHQASTCVPDHILTRVSRVGPQGLAAGVPVMQAVGIMLISTKPD